MDICMKDIRFCGKCGIAYWKHADMGVPVPFELIEKISLNDYVNTPDFHKAMELYISACIEQYHSQLREKLLEKGIDIGEINFDAQPYKDDYLFYEMSHRI